MGRKDQWKTHRNAPGHGACTGKASNLAPAWRPRQRTWNQVQGLDSVTVHTPLSNRANGSTKSIIGSQDA